MTATRGGGPAAGFPPPGGGEAPPPGHRSRTSPACSRSRGDRVCGSRHWLSPGRARAPPTTVSARPGTAGRCAAGAVCRPTSAVPHPPPWRLSRRHARGSPTSAPPLAPARQPVRPIANLSRPLSAIARPAARPSRHWPPGSWSGRWSMTNRPCSRRCSARHSGPTSAGVQGGRGWSASGPRRGAGRQPWLDALRAPAPPRGLTPWPGRRRPAGAPSPQAILGHLAKRTCWRRAGVEAGTRAPRTPHRRTGLAPVARPSGAQARPRAPAARRAPLLVACLSQALADVPEAGIERGDRGLAEA